MNNLFRLTVGYHRGSGEDKTSPKSSNAQISKKTAASVFGQSARGPGLLLVAALMAIGPDPRAWAALTHRYSFTNAVTDSVGGAHGQVHNNVTISGGAARFPGGISGPNCAYLQLPPGLISNYTAVTFEFWVN